jgi:hypothetical protein
MARYKTALIVAFKPHFKEKGFIKKAATWYRTTPEMVHVFNIQTSQWSERYYFNAGIYFRALGSLKTPAEAHCHIRTRIPDSRLHEDGFQCACDLADFEHVEFHSEARITELKNLIYPLAIDWFGRFRDLDHAKRQLAGIRRPWFFVGKEVWPLVGLERPK